MSKILSKMTTRLWLSKHFRNSLWKGGCKPTRLFEYRARTRSNAHLCWAVQWNWFAWVNAFCNLSRKKSREVTVSLPGRFLSRRCFTMCIAMEVEPRIVKQYKWHHCCSCKNYWGKQMEGGKSAFASFFGWPEDHDFVEKCILGHEHEQQVIACCQTHSDYGPPKMPLKLAV